MRKIACDIRSRRLTGIYRYGTTLLEHLDKLLLDTDIKLYLLYRPDTQEQAVQDLSRRLPQEHVELIAVYNDYGRIPRSPWILDWVVREGIELYYSIDFVVDKELPIPFIYTVHDIFLHKYPKYSFDTNEEFQAKFGMDEFKLMERDLETVKAYIPGNLSSHEVPTITKYIWAMSRYLGEKSKHIIASTESSKEEIVHYLTVPESKMTVILAAADASCFYPRPDEEAIPVVQKYGLSKNYCLGVGLDLKRKRLEWLLENLARCRADLPQNAKVAIAGKYDNLDQRLKKVASLGLNELVVFPGRVNDDELACLYSKAKALIVPSLDEGFCLPAVEALMCGTEVIVPDTKVLREVAGACGHFYEVEDGNKLGQLITQALNGSLPPKARYFENRFSWDASARQFLELLTSMLEGERADAASAY